MTILMKGGTSIDGTLKNVIIKIREFFPLNFILKLLSSFFFNFNSTLQDQKV
jgi:hypothetical protein